MIHTLYIYVPECSRPGHEPAAHNPALHPPAPSASPPVPSPALSWTRVCSSASGTRPAPNI